MYSFTESLTHRGLHIQYFHSLLTNIYAESIETPLSRQNSDHTTPEQAKSSKLLSLDCVQLLTCFDKSESAIRCFGFHCNSVLRGQLHKVKEKPMHLWLCSELAHQLKCESQNFTKLTNFHELNPLLMLKIVLKFINIFRNIYQKLFSNYHTFVFR